MSGFNINTKQLQSFLGNISGDKNPAGKVKAENLDIKNVYIGKDNKVHVSNSGFMRWIAQKGGRATGAEAFKQAVGENIKPHLEKRGMEHASGRILDNMMKRIDGHQEKHADWSRQFANNLDLRSIGLAVELKESEPSVALEKLVVGAFQEEIPKQQLEDAVAAGKQDAESFIKSCAGDPNPLDKLKSRLGIYENQRANAQKASELPGYKFKENKNQAEKMRTLDPKLEMARLDASISVVKAGIQELQIREKIDDAAGRHGLSHDEAHSLYGQVLEQQKQVAELRKTDPAGTAWLDKTPRQCAKELVDSLCKPTVDVGDVLIKLADFHARVDGFCQSNINLKNNTLKPDVLQDHIDHALGSLSRNDQQRLHENIEANYELCSLVSLAGPATLERDVKEIIENNLAMGGKEESPTSDRGEASSAATITSGLIPRLGDIMCHLNVRVCETLGKGNPIGDPNTMTAENVNFLFSFHKNLDFNSNVSNAKAIWTTLQLAQVNGGSMRKAVEAYKNGANTPEAVAGHFDEKSNWGSGDMMGEIFKVNFGYMLENDAGEGQAVHRFLYEMRVFTPPGSA